MEEEKKKEGLFDHIRSPVLDAIYRNPFDGVELHSKLIAAGMIALKDCMDAYLAGDYSKAMKHAEQINKVEHEADMIKSNIRAHLPKFVLMSVSKRDFLEMLHYSDDVIDYAEDVVVLLSFKETKVPDRLAPQFQALTEKVVECVRTYLRVTGRMKVLLEVNFGGKERDRAKELIKETHKLEHETDIISKKLTRELFNMPPEEMDPVSVYHLLKVVDRLGKIANQAEKSAEWIRAMLAK